MWSNDQILTHVNDVVGVPAIVRQAAAEIQLTLPEPFVIGGGVDYWTGSEGFAARVYTFQEGSKDVPYWNINPVYITVYCPEWDSETVGIDVTWAGGVLLTVAGYGLDSGYRDDVLDSIDRVLREKVKDK